MQRKTIIVWFSVMIATSGICGEPPGFVKKGDIFGTRVFVENRGQFNSVHLAGEPVLYALENGHEKIYFTRAGLIYRLTPEVFLSEPELADKECRKDYREKVAQSHTVFMKWAGSDPSGISVLGDEKQSYYITYGGAEFNASVFGKVVFRNVYPGIDVEYILPQDKGHGIKYSFVVHAGADPSQIALVYEGDVRRMSKGLNGEIEISARGSDLVEHAPLAFDGDGKPVPCEFLLRSDTIRFAFPEGYDHRSPLIIDPWVTSVTAFQGNTFAYDVDYDFFGSVYVYGGHSPTRVAKYNSAGALLWSFSGVVLNPAWTSQPTEWIGNFGVERSTGKCFIGQGVEPSGSRIVRLNQNGNYDNFISTATVNYQEIWDMGFHCSTGKIFTLGGGHNTNTSAATINSLTGLLNLSTFQPTIAGSQQDIASHCIDESGDIFVVYSTNTSPQLNNHLCRVSSGFNGNVWTMPTTFGTLLEAGNKQYGALPTLSNGFNCLAVNQNYLFYYDGRNLAAYSKSGGQLLGSVVITGLFAKKQGGIDADDCNVVYIGGKGQVLSYQFNGQLFSQMPSLPLMSGVASSVFDIKLNKITNHLYVSGHGFVGEYAALCSTVCPPAISACLNNLAISVQTASITCTSPGSATVNVASSGTFTCTWFPGGFTGSVISVPSPATYTVQIAANGQTFSTELTFYSVNDLKGELKFSAVLPCASVNSGTASISNLSGGNLNHVAYLWKSAGSAYTGAFISGLSTGNYSVTVTDTSTGCAFSKTFSVLSPPALTLMLASSSPTACTGTAVALSSSCGGGVLPYVHKWSTGQATPGITVALPAGIHVHTLTVTDANACSISSTVGTSFIPTPEIVLADKNVCPGASGTLVASGAAAYLWNTGITGSQLVASPAATTIFTVTGTSYGCSAAASASLIVLPAPALTLTSNSPVCENAPWMLKANGAGTIAWTDPNGITFGGAQLSGMHATAFQGGIYSVTLTAAAGCSISAEHGFTVYPLPQLTATADEVCRLGHAILRCMGAASCQWYGKGGFISSQPEVKLPASEIVGAAVYTVIGISAQGCQAIATTTVVTLPLPEPFLKSITSQKICTDDSVIFSAGGGLLYQWHGPNGILFNGGTVRFAAVSADYSGTYTLSATNEFGCAATLTTDLLVRPLPEGDIVAEPLQQCLPFCVTYSFQARYPSQMISSIVWDADDRFHPGTAFLKCFTRAGEHAVKVRALDTHGCSFAGSLIVKIQPMPLADFNFSPLSPVAQLDEVQFLNTSVCEGDSKYSWYIHTGVEATPVTGSQKVHLQYRFSEPGVYPVVLVVKDKRGCMDTMIRAIRINEDAAVFIPNAFTPNGDGLNEIFRPVLRGYSLANLLVVDRWGGTIFETSSADKGWDGTLEGAECKTDVYPWKIVLLSADGKEHELTGMVHLLK